MVSDKIRCVTLSKQFGAQVLPLEFSQHAPSRSSCSGFMLLGPLFTNVVKDRDLAVRPFFCQSGRSLAPWSGFLTEQ